MPMKRIGRPSLRAIAMTMPPLAVPSSLVSTRPVTPTASWNSTRLRQRVLALVGVEHQQHLVRRGRVDALDHAPHLLQLVHEVRLAVQPAGGVGDHHVDAARAARPVTASNTTAPGSAPACCCDDLGAAALGPDVELFDGGGAERVARGEQHLLAPSLRQRRASLPMVVVLPEPLTPTTSMTNGLRVRSIAAACCARLRGCAPVSRAARSAARRRRRARCARPSCAGPRGCDCVASTPTSAVDQPRLELIEQLGVDLAAANRPASSSAKRAALRLSFSFRRPKKRWRIRFSEHARHCNRHWAR